MRRAFAQISVAALLAAAIGSAPALAGGFLESLDITGFVPSPVPGQVNARLVRIFHDPRCIPVPWHVNNTIDPVPNPLGAPFLSLAGATTAFNKSFDAWNNIPTSYINERIVGTTANPGLAGFDMVNELTFRTSSGFGAIASTPSITLIADSQLVDGDDIDGDGTSDVSSAITTCTVAPDGHTIFPAGFYKAGTILDVDVQFNVKASNGFRFTVNDADADTSPGRWTSRRPPPTNSATRSACRTCSTTRRARPTAPRRRCSPSSTPGTRPPSFAQRSLDSDDIAFASLLLSGGDGGLRPGGAAAGGHPLRPRLRPIKGSVTHGVLNQPVAGASVSATNALTGELFATAFSGTTQLSYDPNTGGIFLVSPSYNILNGNYTLPVKLGLYKIGDRGGRRRAGAGQLGQPQRPDRLDLRPAEFQRGVLERSRWRSAIEVDPGFALPVAGVPSLTVRHIDFVTNNQINISNFGSRDFIGFTGQPAGSYYAVRIPASQISAVNPGGDLYIQEALYDTFVVDASVVPVFAEATLATGTVSGGTATLDLAHPLARVTRFVGQDNDFAPFYFPLPSVLGRQVRRGIDRGDIQNLFLVLRLPTTTPFPGVSATPPTIGLDGGNATNDVPIFGYSYVSADGVTWTQVTNFNFRFSLVVTKAN